MMKDLDVHTIYFDTVLNPSVIILLRTEEP